MKKLFSLLCLLISTFTFVDFNNNTTNIVNAEEDVYSVDSFTSLPENWQLYRRSDTVNTTTTYSNNEMIIKNSGPGSNSSYYGTVYNINIDKAYTDFTFEVTAKMVNPTDANRWFGIGYHTQLKAEQLVGYLMNYRSCGDSAYSAFNSVQSFADGSKVNVNVPLSDGNFHVFKITMVGKTATHYIDNKQIVQWDVSERDSHLGNYLSAGGFSLFVNKSTVHIKNVSISGTLAKINPNNLVKDEELASTYFNPSRINFPTVVLNVDTQEILNTIPAATQNPSNAILHIDENMNVVDKNKTILGKFTDIYKTNLAKKIIPVIYLENDAQANALIEFLRDELFILDLSIMSSNPELIKKVKSIHSSVRGILEFDDNSALKEIVPNANKNYANVAVLSQKFATKENVRYIHARFKTVWVKPTSENKMDLINAINSEAYGLIVSDFKNLYSTYSTFETNSIARMPFNVAHRGIPTLCNENSVEGTKKAIEVGATHIEIDAYLTTDGKVAIMHDYSIDRTSNGTGNVESMTLAQLQQYQLDLMEPKEKIPSLAEIIVPIKESDAILVLEIKSGNVNIVKAIKEELTALNMLDKTIVISFNAGIIGKMKEEFPEIPTAILGNIADNAASLYTFGSLNTVADSSTMTNVMSDTFYRDRGFTSWAWTFANNSTVQQAIIKGIVGITNNVADYFSTVIMKLEGIPTSININEFDENTKFDIKATYYNGTSEILNGKVFYYEEFDDYYEVVCKYSINIVGYYNNVIYTQSFRVDKINEVLPPTDNSSSIEETPSNNNSEIISTPSNEKPETPNNKGCKSSFASSFIVLLLLLSSLKIKSKKIY